MKKSLIGVLGCGGELGQVACKILKENYRIRGGQRSALEGLNDDANFQWIKVDLYNENELYNFCNGCDVILNCAGPSYLVGDRVAIAAAKVKAGYVDAFGADNLEKALMRKGIDKEGIFVISAGSFPGVSGILPRWLAMRDFDCVSSMLAFAGGREHCSRSAGLDLLLSSISNYGIPNSYIKNNVITRSSDESIKKVYIPFLKEEVYQQKYLNSETLKVANLLDLEEAYWYNIIVDKFVNEVIVKACTRLTVERGENMLEESIGELCEAADMALSGKQPWYVICAELQGRKDGKLLRKRSILHSKSSYELSGAFAAVVTETVLKQNLHNGVHWAFEIAEPIETIEKLILAKAIEKIDIVNIAPVIGDGMLSETEEGVL